MDERDALSQMQAEVDKAVLHVRGALGRRAQRQQLTGNCALLVNLIGRVEISVVPGESDAAFYYNKDDESVNFFLEPLVRTWNNLFDISGELSLSGEEILHLQRMGLSQFLVHELIHINQNFSDFDSGGDVKVGLGDIGVPLLDITADIMSAWIVALVESEENDPDNRDYIIDCYVQGLLRAYIILSFVFGAKRAEKRQRALSLLVSMLLVQAMRDERLNRNAIYHDWHELCPVFVLNLSHSDVFNAIVINSGVGLLFDRKNIPEHDDLNVLWESIGCFPITETLNMLSRILSFYGVYS